MTKLLQWQYQSHNDDFIKALYKQQDYLVMLTEKSKINLIQFDGGTFNTQISTHGATPLYDLIVSNHIVAISSREYPVCLYTINGNQLQSIGRIHDIKPNSETFLTPLQMKFRTQFSDILACGIGFLHSFDLSKMKVSQSFKSITQKQVHCSCLDLPDTEGFNYNQVGRVAAVGLFNKTIHLVDLDSDKLINTLKIHLGGITQVKFAKHNPIYLYSCARQDNFIYCWDLRNTSTFVTYLERKNSTNQRTSFDLAQDLAVYGNDDGTANIIQDDQQKQISVSEQCCVNSSVILNDNLVAFAWGERQFLDADGEENNSGFSVYYV